MRSHSRYFYTDMLAWHHTSVDIIDCGRLKHLVQLCSGHSLPASSFEELGNKFTLMNSSASAEQQAANTKVLGVRASGMIPRYRLYLVVPMRKIAKERESVHCKGAQPFRPARDSNMLSENYTCRLDSKTNGYEIKKNIAEAGLYGQYMAEGKGPRCQQWGQWGIMARPSSRVGAGQTSDKQVDDDAATCFRLRECAVNIITCLQIVAPFGHA